MFNKKFFTLILLTTSLFSKSNYNLTSKQIRDTQIVYTVGKNIKASNGTTFQMALTGMFAQESSWGALLVGDKYDSTGRLKSLYDSSLGPLQVKLSTAKLTIKKYKHLKRKYGHLLNTGESTYKEYTLHKKKIQKYLGIISNPVWVKRYKEGSKKAADTMKWARKQLRLHTQEFNNSREQAMKDTALINLLMNNTKASAEIAGGYLLSMYEEALKKGFSDPWGKAVGRYNGGWKNTRYLPKVKERIKTLKKLIKDSKIK